MTVPTPASFTYFWQNTTIIAKYALSGVIEFIGESPTRYAASIASGGTPSFISSGTKIGAKIAHFGIAPVMIRSRIITTITKPIISHTASRLAACRMLPSEIAASGAMLV